MIRGVRGRVQLNQTMANDASRKALVTGGASGFGRGVVRGLRASGSQVAAIDLDGSALDDLDQQDNQIFALNVDVSDKVAVTRAVRAAAERFDGLDTVILCAGIWYGGPLEDFPEEQWDRTIAVNLKGAFLVAQAATPWLKASRRGRIVAISSDAGLKGYPERAAYCASKFGLIGLCESMAAELAGDGVTVNAVCPSWCPTTGMGGQIAEILAAKEGSEVDDLLSSMEASFPNGRSVRVDDVVATILFLTSNQASMLTGQTIEIDGGVRYGAFRSPSVGREGGGSQVAHQRVEHVSNVNTS